MTIRAVSFDVWDTLLRLEPFHFKIAEEAAVQEGLDPTALYDGMLENYRVLKEYRSRGLLRNDDIVNHCLELSSENLGVSVESLKKGVTKAVLRISIDDLVHHEAVGTLEQLSREGRQIVTLGNLIFWPGAYNRILIERAGLTKYFRLQLYADDLKASKPSGEVFENLCRSLGLKPEEVVHVGDNRSEDFEGALEFGLYAILIRRSLKEGVLVEGRGVTVSSVSMVPQAIGILEDRNSCLR